MIWKIIMITLCLSLAALLCRAEGEPPLRDELARDSYALGYEFGGRIRKQGLEVDVETLISAMRSGLAGKDPAMSANEMGEALRELRKKVMIVAKRRSDEAAALNLQKSSAFLAENKTKEGVITLPSGLQYKVIRVGSGPVPKAADTVKVNYRGTLIDGTEFDNSQKRGEAAAISVKSAIKGWSEALRLMKTGSKWQLFVPAELAYGKRQFGRIPPNSTLIFELELLSITPEGDGK